MVNRLGDHSLDSLLNMGKKHGPSMLLDNVYIPRVVLF